MDLKFNYESNDLHDGELCYQYEIEMSIDARVDDDYEWEITSIENKQTKQSMQLKDFSEKHQSEIEKQAEALAADNAYEAYNDYCIDRAEWLCDAYKDGTYE